MEVLQLCCHAAADLVQSHTSATVLYIHALLHLIVLSYGLSRLHSSSFVAMQLCNHCDTSISSFVAMRLHNNCDTCTHVALLPCSCLSILYFCYFYLSFFILFNFVGKLLSDWVPYEIVLNT